MTTTPTGLARHLRTLIARQASSGLPDRQLLETFLRERSEASFAALVRRHGPMVLSVCRRVLRHTQDAEDAFQAAFLVLARRAGSIRKHESVSSFLHGVAYRVAEKLRAKAARRAACERNRTVPPPADVMEDITWRELRRVLDEELHKLPEQYRAPLVLCYLEGKTRDEAARQLDWTKAVFRRRLERGRDLLGRLLSRRGVTLSAALCAPLLAGLSAAAAPPSALADATVRVAVRLALGESATGLVSAQVAALTEASGPTLLAGKLKVIAALLLAAGIAAGGWFAHQALVAGAAQSQAAETPPTAPKASAAPPIASGQTIAVRGRVLGPDGKPVPGAKVYVSTYTDKDKSDPKVRGTTDADGPFRFTADRAEVDRNEMLAAVAPGFGPDWVPLKDAGGGEPTLRLVKDDVPIRGRVLDLEGHPVAGVTVRMLSVRKLPGEDLTPWLKELLAKPNDRYTFAMKYQRIMSSVWGILGSPKHVKTDAGGRFRLRGFGRDRIVDLRIEGPDIEYRNVTVITRPDVTKELPSDMHGANFEYVAAPGKLIRGTVREKGSGKPVAGAHVVCTPSVGQVAVTDKEGRYEIPGIRKSEQYSLSVGGARIIFHVKQIGDTPGLRPITEDFEVERGLLVRVRVTEKGTGKAVTGMVWYSPAADNPNLKNYTTYPQNLFAWDVTEKDGTFKQVVLPGRGFIAFRADEDRFIPSRIKRQNVRVALVVTPLTISHAVVPINPSADDPKSLVCNIVLDPGREVSGEVVGTDDRPLTGVSAAGLGSVHPLFREPELPDNRFTVRGLEPGKPRTVVFWHESKGLARAVVVRGEEKTPLKVRLEPRGALTGKLADAKGRPLRGIAVIPRLSDKQAAPLAYFASQFGESSLPHAALPAPVVTDAEGRFRIKGFVSGLNYALVFRENHKDIAEKDIAIKPGATVDVGEIKVKAPSEKDVRKEGP